MKAREFLELKNIKPLYRLIDGEETGEFIVTPQLMVEFAQHYNAINTVNKEEAPKKPRRSPEEAPKKHLR